MPNKLTPKQENFCQAYIRLGDKSAAYREVYSTDKMKPKTVNEAATRMFYDSKITARIEQLQSEVKKRNDVTIDEIVSVLAGMMRFDIGDLYDENGKLKPIHQIPKHARLMIQQLDSDELTEYVNGNKMIVGSTKKVKVYSKNDAIEKLMKHLGGYEKDNMQKANIFSAEDRAERLAALKSKM